MEINLENNNYLKFAKYYFQNGLNVTSINKNKYTDKEDASKTPKFKFWKMYQFKRQEKFNLNEFVNDCSGVGVVLGFKDLRCIDIDECNDIDFVFEVLQILNLPIKYDWVTKSGNGFHIIFYCNNHFFPTAFNKIKAFGSNGIFKFGRLELRWVGHLVMPPSIHSIGKEYKFLNNEIPESRIQRVKLSSVEEVVKKFCNDSKFLCASGVYLDYGPSYISQNLSLIQNNLFPRFKSPKKLIFTFRFLEKDDVNSYEVKYINNILYQISWILIDSNNELIEFCNYLVKPVDLELREIEKFNILTNLGFIAADFGEDLDNVLISFKNRCSEADKCYFLDSDGSNEELLQLSFLYSNLSLKYIQSPNIENITDLINNDDFIKGLQNKYKNKTELHKLLKYVFDYLTFISG